MKDRSQAWQALAAPTAPQPPPVPPAARLAAGEPAEGRLPAAEAVLLWHLALPPRGGASVLPLPTLAHEPKGDTPVDGLRGDSRGSVGSSLLPRGYVRGLRCQGTCTSGSGLVGDACGSASGPAGSGAKGAPSRLAAAAASSVRSPSCLLNRGSRGGDATAAAASAAAASACCTAAGRPPAASMLAAAEAIVRSSTAKGLLCARSSARLGLRGREVARRGRMSSPPRVAVCQAFRAHPHTLLGPAQRCAPPRNHGAPVLIQNVFIPIHCEGGGLAGQRGVRVLKGTGCGSRGVRCELQGMQACPAPIRSGVAHAPSQLCGDTGPMSTSRSRGMDRELICGTHREGRGGGW